MMGDLILCVFMVIATYLFAGLMHEAERAQDCLRTNYTEMDGVRFHCVKVDKNEPTK